LGFISDREYLAKLYASSDGFVSPGHRETFGLGICEALASGLPVLSADAGGGAEMVSRFPCGLLFKSEDASDLSRKARILVSSDFRAGITMARNHLASHNSWDKVLRAYVDHHEELKARKETGDPLHP
jgi:glycosyltransferase involved in cell wall biosynthesis